MCNYCVFTVSKLIVLYVLRFKRELFSYIAVSSVRGITWLSEPSRGSSSRGRVQRNLATERCQKNSCRYYCNCKFSTSTRVDVYVKQKLR
jgi:hypothetical protein